jgi:hypothetical protein
VRELAGFATHKPFECVGTFEEVRASLKYLLSAGILSESINGDLADLHSQIISTSTAPIQDILARWNAQHFVPDELAELLRIHLVDAGERLT